MHVSQAPDHGHHHHGHHGHHHGHSHARLGEHTSLGNARKLAFVLVLVLAYAFAEVIGGLVTGSLALLADASHMFSDVAALSIALIAIWIGRQPPTPLRTFGLHRAEVLGALINAVTLIVIAIFIFKEAWERFQNPPEVLGGPMLLVAIGGLVVNLIGVVVLHGGQQHSLNVRGAWLHMLADTLGSVGAIASAALIYGWKLYWADPLASAIIGSLVLFSSLALLRDTVEVLLESAPSRLDLVDIEHRLAAVDGVLSIHDLHAWTIGSGREALMAHVVAEEGRGQSLLPVLVQLLRESFELDHVTLQIEDGESQCDDCAFHG